MNEIQNCLTLNVGGTMPKNKYVDLKVFVHLILYLIIRFPLCNKRISQVFLDSIKRNDIIFSKDIDRFCVSSLFIRESHRPW